MNLNAYRVQKGDTISISFIVENLLEDVKEVPSQAHLAKLISDDRTYLFAVKQSEHIIGYALAYRFPSLYASDYLAYLYDIEVLKSHRRIGAGRLLIKTICDQLKSDGVSELWLGTATDNKAGQALFSKTGGIKSKEIFNDFTFEL